MPSIFAGTATPPIRIMNKMINACGKMTYRDELSVKNANNIVMIATSIGVKHDGNSEQYDHHEIHENYWLHVIHSLY